MGNSTGSDGGGGSLPSNLFAANNVSQFEAVSVALWPPKRVRICGFLTSQCSRLSRSVLCFVQASSEEGRITGKGEGSPCAESSSASQCDRLSVKKGAYWILKALPTGRSLCTQKTAFSCGFERTCDDPADARSHSAFPELCGSQHGEPLPPARSPIWLQACQDKSILRQSQDEFERKRSEPIDDTHQLQEVASSLSSLEATSPVWGGTEPTYIAHLTLEWQDEEASEHLTVCRDHEDVFLTKVLNLYPGPVLLPHLLPNHVVLKTATDYLFARPYVGPSLSEVLGHPGLRRTESLSTLRPISQLSTDMALRHCRSFDKGYTHSLEEPGASAADCSQFRRDRLTHRSHSLIPLSRSRRSRCAVGDSYPFGEKHYPLRLHMTRRWLVLQLLLGLIETHACGLSPGHLTPDSICFAQNGLSLFMCQMGDSNTLLHRGLSKTKRWLLSQRLLTSPASLVVTDEDADNPSCILSGISDHISDTSTSPSSELAEATSGVLDSFVILSNQILHLRCAPQSRTWRASQCESQMPLQSSKLATMLLDSRSQRVGGVDLAGGEILNVTDENPHSLLIKLKDAGAFDSVLVRVLAPAQLITYWLNFDAPSVPLRNTILLSALNFILTRSLTEGETSLHSQQIPEHCSSHQIPEGLSVDFWTHLLRSAANHMSKATFVDEGAASRPSKHGRDSLGRDSDGTLASSLFRVLREDRPPWTWDWSVGACILEKWLRLLKSASRCQPLHSSVRETSGPQSPPNWTPTLSRRIIIRALIRLGEQFAVASLKNLVRLQSNENAAKDGGKFRVLDGTEMEECAAFAIEFCLECVRAPGNSPQFVYYCLSLLAAWSKRLTGAANRTRVLLVLVRELLPYLFKTMRNASHQSSIIMTFDLAFKLMQRQDLMSDAPPSAAIKVDRSERRRQLSKERVRVLRTAANELIGIFCRQLFASGLNASKPHGMQVHFQNAVLQSRCWMFLPRIFDLSLLLEESVLDEPRKPSVGVLGYKAGSPVHHSKKTQMDPLGTLLAYLHDTAKNCKVAVPVGHGRNMLVSPYSNSMMALLTHLRLELEGSGDFARFVQVFLPRLLDIANQTPDVHLAQVLIQICLSIYYSIVRSPKTCRSQRECLRHQRLLYNNLLIPFLQQGSCNEATCTATLDALLQRIVLQELSRPNCCGIQLDRERLLFVGGSALYLSKRKSTRLGLIKAIASLSTLAAETSTTSSFEAVVVGDMTPKTPMKLLYMAMKVYRIAWPDNDEHGAKAGALSCTRATVTDCEGRSDPTRSRLRLDCIVQALRHFRVAAWWAVDSIHSEPETSLVSTKEGKINLLGGWPALAKEWERDPHCKEVPTLPMDDEERDAHPPSSSPPTAYMSALSTLTYVRNTSNGQMPETSSLRPPMARPSLHIVYTNMPWFRQSRVDVDALPCPSTSSVLLSSLAFHPSTENARSLKSRLYELYTFSEHPLFGVLPIIQRTVFTSPLTFVDIQTTGRGSIYLLARSQAPELASKTSGATSQLSIFFSLDAFIRALDNRVLSTKLSMGQADEAFSVLMTFDPPGVECVLSNTATPENAAKAPSPDIFAAGSSLGPILAMKGCVRPWNLLPSQTCIVVALLYHRWLRIINFRVPGKSLRVSQNRGQEVKRGRLPPNGLKVQCFSLETTSPTAAFLGPSAEVSRGLTVPGITFIPEFRLMKSVGATNADSCKLRDYPLVVTIRSGFLSVVDVDAGVVRPLLAFSSRWQLLQALPLPRKSLSTYLHWKYSKPDRSGKQEQVTTISAPLFVILCDRRRLEGATDVLRVCLLDLTESFEEVRVLAEAEFRTSFRCKRRIVSTSASPTGPRQSCSEGITRLEQLSIWKEAVTAFVDDESDGLLVTHGISNHAVHLFLDRGIKEQIDNKLAPSIEGKSDGEQGSNSRRRSPWRLKCRQIPMEAPFRAFAPLTSIVKSSDMLASVGSTLNTFGDTSFTSTRPLSSTRPSVSQTRFRNAARLMAVSRDGTIHLLA